MCTAQVVIDGKIEYSNPLLFPQTIALRNASQKKLFYMHLMGSKNAK
jgi:hypothetical protein